MKYDPWQQRILAAEGDLLANTGRQVGKTTVFSHKIAEFMRNNPKKQVIVVSLTEDQAKLIIVMVLDYLEKNCNKEIVRKGVKKVTTSRIYLTNGSHVISRPVGNTGDAVRGFTGDVLYVDEASGMPEMMWKAAMPTLMTTGGQIWMSSTPRGKYINNTTKKNFFFKCWENLDERWQVFNITSEKVIKEREIEGDWTEEKREKSLEFLQNQKLVLSDLEYRQEYMGEFLDDIRQWFPDHLIRRCMVAKRPDKISEDWTVSMGNDIARMGEDEGTYEIFRMRGDRLIQLENQVSNKQPITTTADQIIGLHDKFNIDKIFIDDEGALGKGVVDILMTNDDIKRKVQGISNSKRVVDAWGKEKGIKKEELYVQLLSLMEKGRIDLLDDENLFQSFKSVQFAYTNDSQGRRHLKIFGNYTHIVEGITRACEILKHKHLNFWVSSIKV